MTFGELISKAWSPPFFYVDSAPMFGSGDNPASMLDWLKRDAFEPAINDYGPNRVVTQFPFLRSGNPSEILRRDQEKRNAIFDQWPR